MQNKSSPKRLVLLLKAYSTTPQLEAIRLHNLWNRFAMYRYLRLPVCNQKDGPLLSQELNP